MDEIVSTLKDARDDLRLSQQDLADELGVSRSMIAQVESGRRPFPQDRVEDLFRVLAERRKQREADRAEFRRLLDNLDEDAVREEMARIRAEREAS